jgi:hypothetical protein
MTLLERFEQRNVLLKMANEEVDDTRLGCLTTAAGDAEDAVLHAPVSTLTELHAKLAVWADPIADPMRIFDEHAVHWENLVSDIEALVSGGRPEVRA